MMRWMPLLVITMPLAASAGEDAELRKMAGELFGRIEAPAAARLATPHGRDAHALRARALAYFQSSTAPPEARIASARFCR